MDLKLELHSSYQRKESGSKVTRIVKIGGKEIDCSNRPGMWIAFHLAFATVFFLLIATVMMVAKHLLDMFGTTISEIAATLVFILPYVVSIYVGFILLVYLTTGSTEPFLSINIDVNSETDGEEKVTSEST